MNKYLQKILSLLIISAVINTTAAQTLDITGPAGSERFGTVTVLPNGNYIVSDPFYDEGAIANVGAVYLYNGSTHALISTLKGSATDDRVGGSGIIALPGSNFIVHSWSWHNGAVFNAGAITWVNGVTGLSGVVSSANSIIGSQTNDVPGARTDILANGNYVISTPYWSNGALTQAGAITWCSGTTGKSGVIGAS
ncbi:MAG TPA: hypothetical protein VK484_13075, partial [Ferruginibacter sp.]|nr:hypothetical protein [Ferruginibacter sp.]